MTRKGWGGTPPADDDEARKRVVEAAVRSVGLRGAGGTTIAALAEDLGVTRKTVYRYFAGTEELFIAVGEVAMDQWVARLQAATDHLHEPAELLIETVAFIVEQLPREPLLALLLTSGHTASFSAQMLTPRSTAIAREILLSRHVDWAAHGYDDATLGELVEFLIRIVQSLIVFPDPPRTGEPLRAYLRRWVGPALAVRS